MYRFVIFLLSVTLLHAASSPCDLNGDGQVNAADAEQATNQAVGIDACDGADLDRNGRCDAVDVQRFINAAMGQECRAAPPPPPPPPPPDPGSGTLVTSYGAKCDGSTNDRNSIQEAFDNTAKWANKTLIFPAGKTCLVAKGLGITGKSGWTIEGQGATIKAANGMCLDGCGPLIRLYNVDQFAINNLNLDGNRANRSPAEKSGGHNFQIQGAKNGHFNDIKSINSTTDNVRIAASNEADTNTISKNLTFTDSKFINAYRNNVSVIEGWNIKFLGTCSGGFNGTCTCQMTGANGARPAAGVDWEPNSKSASPAIDNGLVDGCLLADNAGTGHQTHEIGGSRNITVRNSINRNNSSNGRARGAFGVDAKGELIENNWIGRQAGARFGVIYVSGSGKSSGPNGRATEIRNNRIEGVPPVGDDSRARIVVYYGNYGDGTARFHNNAMTNIGVKVDERWCTPGKAGGNSTTYNNTVDSVLQNPGCR